MELINDMLFTKFSLQTRVTMEIVETLFPLKLKTYQYNHLQMDYIK